MFLAKAQISDYDPSYWDNYYEGTYEDTFRMAFSPAFLWASYKSVFGESPKSFIDLGCGPGHTLATVKSFAPSTKVWGVESQPIPKDRLAPGVSEDELIFSDVMALKPKDIPAADLVYVSCSMYIPWEQQEEFLQRCAASTLKAVFFANLYLEDKRGIPFDVHRKIIYKSRAGFSEYVRDLGLIEKGNGFYVKN